MELSPSGVQSRIVRDGDVDNAHLWNEAAASPAFEPEKRAARLAY